MLGAVGIHTVLEMRAAVLLRACRFVGTGAIAEAVVRGMCTSPSLSSPPQILLSPRSASRSAALATEFKTCAVASTNQEVVDKCDLVVVALLAQNASTALKELSFRPGQQIGTVSPRLVSSELSLLNSSVTSNEGTLKCNIFQSMCDMVSSDHSLRSSSGPYKSSFHVLLVMLSYSLNKQCPERYKVDCWWC